MNNRKALLVIDLQNDFLPGGALAVPFGDEIIPIINRLTRSFEIVVATQDWHPKGHKSFASSHPGKKPYDVIDLGGVRQVLWPDHCVQDKEGARLHNGLYQSSIRAIIRKGMNLEVDSYSGFFDNKREYITGLDGYLKALHVDHIYLVGLATDYCVYFTGMDGLEIGFKVSIILDATRGIDIPKGSMEERLSHFEKMGGKIIKSTDLTLIKDS